MKYRRTKKLIKSGLQLKLVVVFASMACISALFQVVLLNYSLMQLARDMAVDSDLLLSRLSGLLITNLVVTLGTLLPLMLFFGVLITHRVAGPIYKFERYLLSVANGDEQGECHIRKGDELQELCAIINTAVKNLRDQGAEEQPADDTRRAA